MTEQIDRFSNDVMLLPFDIRSKALLDALTETGHLSYLAAKNINSGFPLHAFISDGTNLDILASKGVALLYYHSFGALDQYTIISYIRNMDDPISVKIIWYWTYYKFPFTQAALNIFESAYDYHIKNSDVDVKRDLYQIRDRVTDRNYPIIIIKDSI